MARPTLHPLLELTRARMLEFLRDPEAVFWVFVFPVLLALVLGIAFRSTEEERPRAALSGPGAAALLARVEGAAGPPAADFTVLDEPAAAAALKAGRVDLVVTVETEGAPPALRYRFDPSRPGARAALRAADETLQRAFGRADPLPVTEDHGRAPGGRYIDFLLPGLIGLNVMGSCMWGMGYAIVDARRRKLLKRFAVTPMVRSHFLLAFALSRLVFLAAEVGLLVVFGWLVFGVRVQGSLLLVGALALAGTVSFSGLALLIASRTDSTESASGWMSFVQLPMWLLSGSFFTYERFPDFLHPWIRALPLTALNDALRAVVNEGAGLASVSWPLLVLAAWGAVAFAVSLRIFRWQ